MATQSSADAVTYKIEAPSELAAIHAWTKEYKLNVSRSQLQRNEDGDIQDTDRQRPMRRSKRNGCKMHIGIVTLDAECPQGPWKIRYARDGSRQHNHPPSEDVRAQFDAAGDASTNQGFTDRAAKLRNMSGVMTDYLDRYWWPHKRKIMRCWANNYCHFG
ncbi:hypothetical protein PHMEG_00015971 [Phytophthora megakarya]|uniref:FAR1 domain-containing protein n=1 Tax=Phytophthora megakarya TaxID=4795 RepID=A0A225W0E5_9STRA|nr:hypothetical protein PHMEG_00015971 [Phytophthora megakarya]